jgi:hypothetical protein
MESLKNVQNNKIENVAGSVLETASYHPCLFAPAQEEFNI